MIMVEMMVKTEHIKVNRKWIFDPVRPCLCSIHSSINFFAIKRPKVRKATMSAIE